jgi:hypothetical protein
MLAHIGLISWAAPGPHAAVPATFWQLSDDPGMLLAWRAPPAWSWSS